MREWKFLEEWYNKRPRLRRIGRDEKTFGHLMILAVDVGKYYKAYVTNRWPEHFYIKRQSFGISRDVFDELCRDDVQTIFIRYHGVDGVDGVVWYSASMDMWRELGFHHIDEQTGEQQIHLQIKEMLEIKSHM